MPKGLPSSERRAPTEAEMKAIVKYKDKGFGFFAFFLLCTGMRKGEALALVKSDIDIDKKTISVTKSLEYKNGSVPTVKEPKTDAGVRAVPIPDILVEPLSEWLEGLSGNIIFPAQKSNRNPGGGYMTTKAYDLAWKKWQEETGLDLTAHQLRHGTATILYESGADPYTTKTILGHSNITTTLAIYTELRDKQFKKATEGFNKELEKYK